jgi:rRNA maturation endonuclease Nob1
MMMPLLVVFASVGGVVGKLCRPSNAGSITTMHSVAVLPLLMAVAEPYVQPPSQELQVVDSVEINAPPDRIWREITEARNIQSEELPLSLSHLIGVPKPLEGVNVLTDDGEVRYSKWERGVNFRAVITHREVNRSISWRYEFDANSFPAGSMDEHVAIGGRYFDLRDTTFYLRAHDDGTTTLELQAHYRVTTPINFYAAPVAHLLGRDFVGTILGLYKGRSERGQRVARVGR